MGEAHGCGGEHALPPTLYARLDPWHEATLPRLDAGERHQFACRKKDAPKIKYPSSRMLTDLAAGAVSHLNYQAGYTKGYTNGFKVLLCLSSCPRACPSPPLPPSVAFNMVPSGRAGCGHA